MEVPERVPTGCDPLDELLGGGLEPEVITNVYGPSGSGKTNVCVQAIANRVEAGDSVLMVDTEGGFSAERFLQIHDDKEGLENVYLLEPMTFSEQQEVFDRLESVVDEEGIDLVVVDSLVSLYRIRLDEEVSETNRELSRQLSVLSKIARQYSIPVLVTNQVYSSPEKDGVQMVGQDVPTYWSKCLVELDVDDGDTRRATVRKHRSRRAGIDAVFKITADGLEAVDGDNTVQLY